MAGDLKFAARSLRKNPGFAVVAILSLALGTGANTAIFSLIDAVMLKMIPVARPQQLVFVATNALQSGSVRISRNISLATLQQMNLRAYGVTPADPLALTSVIVILAGVALFAGLLPARRASLIEPMAALRQD